ncbi:MAG: protoporphyrinogen/coproporphyrinogen oxidase [Acidimicrobiales bacterium]
MTEVVVLGAGPAGLMASLEAARMGHTCTLIEAAPRVGGMAGSFEIAGQRVDFGSHRLHTATPAHLLDRIAGLLGDDLQLRPRNGRIHLGRRWVGFPLRPSDLVRSLPVGLTGRLLADSARSLTVSTATHDQGISRSFEEVIADRLGPTVVREFYGPYARKLYGLGPDELDGELAVRRVSAASPSDIARRMFRTGQSDGRTFYYPRRGYGQIVERLADAAVAAGVQIHLQSPVTGVEVRHDRVTVSATTRRIDASVALSTLPLNILATVVEPRPPAAVMRAVSTLRTRAMVLVYLVLAQPQYTPYDTHYLPGADTTTARLSEPKNFRDGNGLDPPDRTVLCAELVCWPGDDLWRLPTDQLGQLVIDDLARLGLPPVEPVGVEVLRLPSVYPFYDLVGAAARAAVDEWVPATDRLLSLGRQGLRVIDNLHHVIAMGAAAAHSIGHDGRIDTVRWRHHLAEFATHVVED